MFDITQIKSRITCLDYAQRIGLPVRKDGDRCCSPLRTHADNKTAFVVHKDYWFDFVIGKGGDVIDLCAFTQFNGDRGQAIRELARITGITNSNDYTDWKERVQSRVSLIQTWHEALRPQDREYLHARRITDETIDRLRIGFTGLGIDVIVRGETKSNFAAGRIAIPAYKNGYVIGWVARATRPEQQPKYLKPPCDEITEYEPWGLHTLDRQSDTLYIAEGAFDALVLDQSGLPVLATMGGYFGRETLKNVLAIAKDYKQVVLTFDNDEAGRKFTRDFGEILFNHRIRFAVAEIPNKYKDISDYYADGGEIKDLKLQDGILYLAKLYNSKDDFKVFAYKAARMLDKAEIAELIAEVKRTTDCFSEVWLKEIQNSCFRAPPEPIIVNEIIERHRLLYIANAGFYEYLPCGKWERLQDEVIHEYISEALGSFTSGRRLEPIAKLMRAKLLSKQEFDRKPVVNFINGTLELETGTFREHREEDFCSIQLPYAYDPSAKCPRWEKFLEEVTAGDPKRQEILQFIAGYAMLSDCRYEKIFVLTGSGGNGKTIYTKILTQLFGPENVTNITPAGLCESFQAIHLRNAILNIAGEIKSDISEAEERLKQIASGEPVQACYKGKDHIIFRPRAKLIFCCNGQLRASDTSDGLARRLSIIDFPCKFVDFPDPSDPYQRTKDVQLEPKLLAELSGIFNWAYQGYKDLLYFNGFTETDEHEQLMENFRKVSNPIEAFIEDLMDDPPEQIERQKLYNQYYIWCDMNGHRPVSSTRFHPEFREKAKQYYVSVDKSVRMDGNPRKWRGYVLASTPKCSQVVKSVVTFADTS